jgi:hypothetical protein
VVVMLVDVEDVRWQALLGFLHTKSDHARFVHLCRSL